MKNLIGKGFLVGVKSYKKDDVQKVIYSVVSGDKGQDGLFSDIDLIQVVETDFKIKNPKFWQEVTFETGIDRFGDKTFVRYSNIQPC